MGGEDWQYRAIACLFAVYLVTRLFIILLVELLVDGEEQ